MQECNEMTNIMQMNGIMEKLTILSDAAKYDVACTSSGVHRGGDGKNISVMRLPEMADAFPY